MKHLYILLMFLLPFSICSAQPLINFTNEWESASCCFNFINGQIDCSTTSYHFDENITIINNLPYHELLRSGFSGFFEAPPFFREDNSKVYFIDNSLEEEFLAYDFSVTVGQTVTVGENHFNLTVMALDSITLSNGEKRKRIQLNLVSSTDISTYWIEGIGGTDAPLNPDYTFTTDCWSFLSCFKNNIGPLYSTGNCTTGTSSIAGQKTAVTLFPNPANDQLTLEGILPGDIQTIQINDQLGREVFTMDNPASTVVVLSGLSKGLYFIMVKSKKGDSYHQRFIKL